MADTIFGSGNDQWVCPNDRQLALRAKLQTGWSVHTYQTEKQRRSQRLSPAEVEAILQVIQRAEQLDTLEQQRIGKSAPNVGSRPLLVRSGPCGCVRSAVSKERSGRGRGPGSTKGSPSIFRPRRAQAGLMTPTSGLSLWNGQSQSPEALRPAASTRGLEGEWFPVTVTVTQISALLAWRTDSRPVGPGKRKATNPWRSQVAAWSLPEWASPAHAATSRGAKAAWPARPGQEALRTLRGARCPSLSPRALAKDTPGGLPTADVAFEGGSVHGANSPVGDCERERAAAGLPGSSLT
ncbi:PREDICTED: rab effector Noc2 isoform X2 [Chinchilla lanigera]|uniref:rab effector Noc2 isoform X2 n=1 Tax=Chinchilla lanigera TaxID=34839 RepID=UPI000695EB7B|nr:PREDICTED: rab effector Noc2 isoform X2 [Chinchilla lanigera]